MKISTRGRYAVRLMQDIAPQSTCPRRKFCAALPLWTGLDRVIRAYLQQYTIQDPVR